MAQILNKRHRIAQAYEGLNFEGRQEWLTANTCNEQPDPKKFARSAIRQLLAATHTVVIEDVETHEEVAKREAYEHAYQLFVDARRYAGGCAPIRHGLRRISRSTLQTYEIDTLVDAEMDRTADQEKP